MPTFKQKNVIKSYKLRLQEKLKTVTEETENATSFLHKRVEEFKNRVHHILEIKDEKCLSLYRKLSSDLESYSEKLFILQASFEEGEDSNSSEDDSITKVPKDLPKSPVSVSTQDENLSQDLSNVDGNVTVPKYIEQNVTEQKHEEKKLNLQRHSVENVNLPDVFKESTNEQNPPEEGLNLQKWAEKNVNVTRYLEENFKYSCPDDDGGSITEDDFYSLHSDNNAQNTNNTLLESLHACNNETVPASDYTSNISVSQSSCYRSISSNISESLTFLKENKKNLTVESKNECSLESSEIKLVIPPVEFEISSSFSATLLYINDPSDFWIQIEKSYGSKLRFPKSEYAHLDSLAFIKEGEYCLAPFKSTPFYYRAKSFSNGQFGKESVKVQFIDHGSTQGIHLCDLRPLPASAYEIPAQAINCYLHGIASTGDSWSDKATERFKDFQTFCFDTVIKSRENLYGVQLVARLSTDDFSEKYTVDVAQALCLDGFAISLNESSSCSVSENEQCESQLTKSPCNNTDSSLEVSGFYDINALSSDSGVSVASAYKSSQISCKRNEIFTKVSGDYSSSVALKNTFSSNNESSIGVNHDMLMNDLISFESNNTLDMQNSSEVLQDSGNFSCCLSFANKNFCLHLKVPSPSLFFYEKDMVVVMLSHIVNPHEFYANLAKEEISTLDELRDDMQSTYNSEKNLPNIKISDLTENMFCAGRFNDDYWYRVKIIRISPEDKKKNEVLAQYVDYGNSAIIKCCDLKPLTLEFSKPPCFAIAFALAGVTPVKNETSGEESPYWSEKAIEVFKELTSFDRCLTAQICHEIQTCNDQNGTYSVLLWDFVDSKDLLINASLADRKVAIFDESIFHPSSSSNQKTAKPHIDSWNPMLEEYVDSHNSYAVDDEDIEVATTGYQAKDEEYTCKYYSLRGYCPRGKNCPYEHLPLLESGVTRDQEEVYCLDTVPIISETVSNVLVQVSAIITPSHFYVVLPFGCKTVDDIDDLVSKGASYNEIINSEAKALFYAVDKHYSNTPFNENTSIALSCGTIVAAKRKWDDKWHRGRIVDVVGINKPAKVFFVDSGDHEWVSRKFIRTILQQYLYTPFQAVQCSLHGIEPVGSKDGSCWSSEALNYFKDVVAGEILLAEIVHRFGQVFHVSLRKTSRNDHKTVSQCLVSAGHAKFSKINPKQSDKKKTVYVPG